MKSFFIAALLLISSTTILFGLGKQISVNDKTKQEIILTTVTNNPGSGRTIVNQEIEAYIFDTGIVEVFLSGIGETTVTILNSQNQIVDEDIVCADMPIIIYLDAHSNIGTYYLVISSTSCYAIGSFTL